MNVNFPLFFSESRKVVSQWLWGSKGIRITGWDDGIEGDHGELCKAK